MDRPLPPALPLALGLTAGVALAYSLPSVPVALAVALAAAGIALGRRRGGCVASLALGLLLPALRGEPHPAPLAVPAPDRPVEAVVTRVGCWQSGRGIRSAAVEISSFRQGTAVGFAPRRAWLSLPEGEPALLPAAPIGGRLRVKGYLGRSDGAWNRGRTEPGPWRLRVKSWRLVQEEGGGEALAELGERLRLGIQRAWGEALERRGRARGSESPGPGLAVAGALLLGDRSGLPEPWLRGLGRSGLAHLLAVSGLHVGLLAGLVLLATAGWPRALRLSLVLAAICFYLLLVGATPALIRASLMAALAVAALALDRPPLSSSSLAWAVSILLLSRPSLVTELSFQLTASATAGLLLAAPPLVRAWSRLPAWLARPLAATAAAQLASLPFALPRFHLLTPLAPLANLLFIPWTACALLGSLGWTALALLFPALAAGALPALDALAAPFGWPAAATGGVGLALPVGLPGGSLGTLAAAVLAAGLYLALLRPRWAPLLLGLVLLPAIPRPAGEAPAPELVMLDVGQGESLLFRHGARAVLVDGGGWNRGDFAGRILLPALLGEGVKRLDAAILTHPDVDHCRGLAGIADYLPVAELWSAPGLVAAGCGGELLLRPGLRQRVLWGGEERTLGAWRLEVLHPGPGERRPGNEGSLVLLATAHGRRFLLTADIGTATERRLVGAWPDLFPVDVLKVAHHGSKGSSSRAFVRAADPRLALVSAGRRNRYHHPAREVVDAFSRRGTLLLRTDRDGAVRLRVLPGGGLQVGAEGPG